MLLTGHKLLNRRKLGHLQESWEMRDASRHEPTPSSIIRGGIGRRRETLRGPMRSSLAQTRWRMQPTRHEEGSQRRRLHCSGAGSRSWTAKLESRGTRCKGWLPWIRSCSTSTNRNDYHILLLLQLMPPNCSPAATCTLSEIHSQSPLVVTRSTL